MEMVQRPDHWQTISARGTDTCDGKLDGLEKIILVVVRMGVLVMIYRAAAAAATSPGKAVAGTVLGGAIALLWTRQAARATTDSSSKNYLMNGCCQTITPRAPTRDPLLRFAFAAHLKLQMPAKNPKPYPVDSLIGRPVPGHCRT